MAELTWELAERGKDKRPKLDDGTVDLEATGA
jgi:hypothetical protein